MTDRGQLDCVIIGHNEPEFEEYESLVRGYGEDSEAYRDLQLSFVDLDGQKLTYVDLLNHVLKIAHQNDERLNARGDFKSCDIPNLAAVYLTNYLTKRGFKAKYINLFQHEKEKLARYLAQDPLCVAITTTLYLLKFPVIEIVKFIRERNKEIKIIVGGPLIANHHQRYRKDEFIIALDDIGADICVIESQGELTLWQIVERLKRGKSLGDVPNIVYSENGESRMAELIPESNSLDENSIDWHIFSDQDLGATVQTRTARGCAFSCAFCGYPIRAGKLTLASLDSVEKELDSIRALGNVKNVVFIDDTFNVPLDRFKDICRLMIKKNYAFNWFSYFRCSNSDEEAIKLMAESGCKGVFLGIESGSPTILKNMHKAATTEQYVEGIKLLRQHNIMTFGSFIVGFPGETERTIDETIDLIGETKPDYYRAQLWYCEPGTPILRQRSKYNISGEGFGWQHATMNSLEAMDHIERMFLTIDKSLWLPQWSFDFWIIPYLLGRGISLERLRGFMTLANKLLALEIAYVPERQKNIMQQGYLQGMVGMAKEWC